MEDFYQQFFITLLQIYKNYLNCTIQRESLKISYLLIKKRYRRTYIHIHLLIMHNVCMYVGMCVCV